jgi:hypothetical protein
MPGKLAAAWRVKYPGAYDSVPDADLETAIKAKFPGAYDNVDTEEADAAAAQKQQGEANSGWWANNAAQPHDSFAYAKAGFAGPQPARPPQHRDWQSYAGDLGGMVAGGAAGALVAGPLGIPAGVIAGAMGSGTAEGVASGDKERGVKRGVNDAIVGGLTAGVLKGASLVPRIPAGMSNVGRTLYRGSLKAQQTPEIADALTEVGIREDINSSRGGYFKAQDLIGTETTPGLTDEVERLVKTLDGEVNPTRGIGMVRSYRDRIARTAPDSDIAAINQMLAEYERKFAGMMQPMDAHGVKKEIWQRNEKTFDANLPPVRKEAETIFGSGLRQEIERLGNEQGVPQIGPLNKRIGEIVELRDALQSGHNRVTPHDATMATAVGPKYAVARTALRPQVQSWVGGKLARAGDRMGGHVAPTVDPLAEIGSAGYRFDDAPDLRVLSQGGMSVAEETAARYLQLGQEMPTPAIAHQTTSSLDDLPHPDPLTRLGVPVERQGATNSLDRYGIPEVGGPSARSADELWLRKFANEQPAGPVSGIEDIAQRGELRTTSQAQIPTNADADKFLTGQKPMTKQALMEQYRRLEHMRGQLEQSMRNRHRTP